MILTLIKWKPFIPVSYTHLFQNISLEEYTEKFGYPEEAAQHVRQGCCVSMLKAQEAVSYTHLDVYKRQEIFLLD